MNVPALGGPRAAAGKVDAAPAVGLNPPVPYKSEVARCILNSLSEEEMWSLAHNLLKRGLIGTAPLNMQRINGIDAVGVRVIDRDCDLADAPTQDVSSNGNCCDNAPSEVASKGRQVVSLVETVQPTNSATHHVHSDVYLQATLGISGLDVAASSSAGEFRNEKDAGLLGSTATTLTVRNLPLSLRKQKKAKAWIDRCGFEGKYDFLVVLFPPRKAKGKSSSYAVVNFIQPKFAQAFAKHIHLQAVPGEDDRGATRINVAEAEVQGYLQNYKQIQKMSPLQLSDVFFAPSSLAKLPPDDRQLNVPTTGT